MRVARKWVGERCSFCGKTQDKVRRLVAGPGVFICDECIALCNEIVNVHPPAHPGAAQTWTRVKTTGRRRGWFWRLFRTAPLQPEI